MPVRQTVQEFAADLDAFAKAVGVEQSAAVRIIVLELLKRIVLRTPVDTGRARNSWMASKGQPTADMKPPGRYGAPNINVDNVQFDPPEGVYWVYNNLPYIEVLEFGLYPNPPKHSTGKTNAGFSVQAPQGMVRISIQELNAEVEAIIRQAGAR